MDAKTRLTAVETLLADPEELRMDPLEGDLYVLRDRLRAECGLVPPQPGSAG